MGDLERTENKKAKKQSSSLVFASKIGFPILTSIIAIFQMIVNIISQEKFSIVAIMSLSVIVLLLITLGFICYIEIKKSKE